jgi:hypothetical protein
LIFGVRGVGGALLLWILTIFCFTILKFQIFHFFYFVDLQKKLCEISQGGKGVFAFLLVNFESFLMEVGLKAQNTI